VTLLDERPTSTDATPRMRLRRNRTALLLAAGLVVVVSVLSLLTAGGASGALDPDAYDPAGSHALSVLLQQQGVDVRRVTDLPAVQAAATESTTVFVAQPEVLSTEELTALSTLPGQLVVAGAGPRTVSGLGREVDVIGTDDPATRSPGCDLIAASNAGRAEVGGFSYRTDGDATGCYRTSNGPTLLPIPDAHLVLVGSTSLFTNKHLATRGNAALALGLLGRSDTLLWLVPAADRDALGDRPAPSPDSLLPDGFKSLKLGLVLAVVVLALHRARRLGRVVPEPLPVVVPAAEAVRGRGRLYRASGALGTAAEALRASARERIAVRVGAGRNPLPEVLVALVADRTARISADLQALLYGPPPPDDAALVRLADDLDTLIQEVAGS
jgi:hypothetical protein